MSNKLRIDQPIVLKAVNGASASPEEGEFYYNSGTSVPRFYDGAGFQDLAKSADLGDYILATEKGAVNGVATLDGSGRIPSSQLPTAATEYQGTFNATTGSPALADGVGNTGDFYIVDVAGSYDAGSGAISYDVGDWAFYNGTIWEKVSNSNAVTSVNGESGAVVLDTGDIAENGNLYYTNARAIASVLTGYAAGAGTVSSSDSILSAIQKLDGNINGKIGAVSEDSTPSLGGNLTLGANVIIHDGDGIKKGSSASNFYEEEYIHSIATLASQSGTAIAELTFAHASFEGLMFEYKMKDSAGNARIGQFMVATDGTDVSLTDMSTDTGNTGITFSAAVNGANIEIRYDSGANTSTMRGIAKRIKA